MSELKEHYVLVEKLMPWWVSNGWNPETLKKKRVKELKGILIRAKGRCIR